MRDRGRRSALPILASVLLCTPASGAPVSALGGEALPLSIVWSDPQRAVTAPAQAVLRSELTGILSSWDIDSRWASGVVKLGRCSSVLVVALNGERLGANGVGVMGTTHRPVQAEPTVWVLVPNVIRTLEPRSRAMPIGAFGLGRAIARVAAHEIVHVLAPRLEHARSGLMRATLGPDDLVAPSLGLDSVSRAALADALRACRTSVDSVVAGEVGLPVAAGRASIVDHRQPRGEATYLVTGRPR